MEVASAFLSSNSTRKYRGDAAITFIQEGTLDGRGMGGGGGYV